MTTHPELAHAERDPVAFDDLVVETAEDHVGPWQPNWPDGTTRRVLGRDPVTGGSVTLLTFPAGYDRLDEAAIAAAGGPQRFEYHSCHEEIVSVVGDYGFGEPELYRFDPPAYLNHPPFWLHPARQRSAEGIMLFVRNSHPVDFGFCDIPHGWDGVEDYAEVAPPPTSPSEAVTMLRLDDVEVAPLAEHGRPLDGVAGALLWADRVTGWQTWLVVAEEGATLATTGDADGTPAGDEWFVLDGEVAFGDGGVVIGRHGYRCDPARYPAGGEPATASSATRALRWVRGGHLTLA